MIAPPPTVGEEKLAADQRNRLCTNARFCPVGGPGRWTRGGNENPGEKSDLKGEAREARVVVRPPRKLRPSMSVKGGERNRLVPSRPKRPKRQPPAVPATFRERTRGATRERQCPTVEAASRNQFTCCRRKRYVEQTGSNSHAQAATPRVADTSLRTWGLQCLAHTASA